MTTAEIGWLAGIVEGEGCIKSCKNSPVIVVAMTDRDVVDRVAGHFRNAVTTRDRKRERDKKDVYTVRVYGRRAIEILMTIYRFLGERRRTRASEVIGRWANSPRNSYNPRLARVKGK